jgi:hypothetical protein
MTPQLARRPPHRRATPAGSATASPTTSAAAAPSAHPRSNTPSAPSLSTCSCPASTSPTPTHPAPSSPSGPPMAPRCPRPPAPGHMRDSSTDRHCRTLPIVSDHGALQGTVNRSVSGAMLTDVLCRTKRGRNVDSRARPIHTAATGIWPRRATVRSLRPKSRYGVSVRIRPNHRGRA